MDQANAKLLRIDTPGTPAANGVVPFTPGLAIDVDVVLDEPMSSHRYQLGAIISSETMVMYVEPAELGGAVIEKGYRVQVRLDGQSAKVMRVIHKRDRVHEGVSHWEIFLQQ